MSSEGLQYPEGELKLSRVSGLSVAHGKVRVGAEAAGVFESGDGGATWSLVSTLDDQPGRGSWNDPDKQPPGHLGMTAILPHAERARPLHDHRPGLRHLRDARRRRLLGAVQRRPSGRVAAGGRAGRLLRPQARAIAGRRDALLPAEPLRHAPKRRRRPHLDRSHRRSADRLRLRRRGAPARPRQLLRDPARSGPRPHDAGRARRPSGGRATPARRGSGSRAACRSRMPTSASCARGSRSIRSTTPASTSGPALGRCSRAPTRASRWTEIASYLPGISSVEVAVVEA